MLKSLELQGGKVLWVERCNLFINQYSTIDFYKSEEEDGVLITLLSPQATPPHLFHPNQIGIPTSR